MLEELIWRANWLIAVEGTDKEDSARDDLMSETYALIFGEQIFDEEDTDEL